MLLKKISPETFESANELIHYVNPTLVPLQNDNSDYTIEQIPLEWKYMEKCLCAFIYDQFHIHKLSPIKHYLQRLMYDVILLVQLNIAAIEPKIDETTRKIRQLVDNIGQLKDKYDKAYIEAKEKIAETTNDVCNYILREINDLKEYPEKLISRETIGNHINSLNSKDEFQRLLQEKLNEIEQKLNQGIIKYIQECTNHIDLLVKDLPKSSTCENFITIKTMLQGLHLDMSSIKKPETSLEFRVQKVEQVILYPTWMDVAQDVLSSLEEADMHLLTHIMYQTFIDEMSKNIEKDLKLTTNRNEEIEESSEKGQERR
jgi:hypothetical protein